LRKQKITYLFLCLAAYSKVVLKIYRSSSAIAQTNNRRTLRSL